MTWPWIPNAVRDPFKIPTFHRPTSTTVASLSSFTTFGTDFFERHVWMNHSPWQPGRRMGAMPCPGCIIWPVQFILQGTDGEVVTPTPSFAYGKFLPVCWKGDEKRLKASKHRENQAIVGMDGETKLKFLHRLYRSLLETSQLAVYRCSQRFVRLIPQWGTSPALLLQCHSALKLLRVWP